MNIILRGGGDGVHSVGSIAECRSLTPTQFPRYRRPFNERISPRKCALILRRNIPPLAGSNPLAQPKRVESILLDELADMAEVKR